MGAKEDVNPWEARGGGADAGGEGGGVAWLKQVGRGEGGEGREVVDEMVAGGTGRGADASANVGTRITDTHLTDPATVPKVKALP